MRQIQSQLRPFERMTREPEHNFFGYYDLQPWSGNGQYHLCHRVGFMDRMQAATDRAELGMIRMSDYRFISLATTYTWNFQQGAMLQWHPCSPDEKIIFNSHHTGAFRGAVRDLVTGEVQLLSRPVATVSPDGTQALSINFSRLFDFRPGYGYAGIPDAFANVPAPEDDGVFLVDLKSGRDKLIIPLARLPELFTRQLGVNVQKNRLLVNHITFNPSGDRFVFLVRNMPMPGIRSEGWWTLVVTSDLSGADLHVMNGFGAASHYIWKDSRHILIYADLPGRGKMALCLARDQAREYEVLSPDFFAFDGHCSYSPNGGFILYDSYPDADGYRKLLLYDTRREKGMLLARLFSGKNSHLPDGDIRCDLHPRWNRDGSAISFDSVHEGHRHVYRMDLQDMGG